MQVFHPELDTELAVKRLDKARAGNQCWRESVTLWRGSWPVHPAHRLIGKTDANRAWFCWYNILLIQHVYDMGWCRPQTYIKWRKFWTKALSSTDALPTPPNWLIGPHAMKIISAQRGCLLAKDRTWYSQFSWPEHPTPPRVTHGVISRWPYIWPKEVE